MRWKRKRDGVIVTTRQRSSIDYPHSSVLVTREDNGHAFWATWDGMYRKYEPVTTTKGDE